MPRVIVPVSDCVDIASHEIRAALLCTIDFSADVHVEPVAPVFPAFSIINGAFVVRLLADSYPDGTIFVSIVNSERVRPKAIVGTTRSRDFVFVGQNHGIFSWLARDFGLDELYDVDDHYLPKPGTPPTFAGKAITAPLAASIACGTAPAALGPSLDRDTMYQLPLSPGTIVHVDNFGLIKFIGSVGDVEDGTPVAVELKGHVLKARYTRRMMSLATGEWAVFPSSSLDLLELGVVRGSAAESTGAAVGDVVKVAVA